MPKEIFPSSFECDCGHQSDFFENTVREMKAMSQKKKVYLADSAPEEHTIVFHRGKLVEIQCPKQSRSPDTKHSSPKSRPPGRNALPHEGYPTRSRRTLQPSSSTSIPPSYAIPIVSMSHVTRASFSIWIGRIMDVSIPSVVWNTPGKWRIGRSPSTSTAMSGMMRRNGSFQGSEHVDGTIEGAMKAGLEAYPA